MTFISDAYTKFMVNTQTEGNQRPSFKLYATVSGLFQRWFSANAETPRNLKHFFNDVDAKMMRPWVDQRAEIPTRYNMILKYFLKPRIKIEEQSFGQR